MKFDYAETGKHLHRSECFRQDKSGGTNHSVKVNTTKHRPESKGTHVLIAEAGRNRKIQYDTDPT